MTGPAGAPTRAPEALLTGAVADAEAAGGTVQLCTFWLDDHLLALPIQSVREVLPARPVTRVPLAPDDVVGLINLRGQVVTVVDLRARLSLPTAAASPTDRGIHVMVGDGGSAVVSLLADRIGQVVEPAADQLAPPPPTLPDDVARLVTAVCTLDEQLVLVLDLDPTNALGGAS